MLDHSLIVFQQIFIMMLLMVMGYILCRKGTLDEPMTGKLSTLRNTYAGPCCLIEAFQRDFDPAMAGHRPSPFWRQR